MSSPYDSAQPTPVLGALPGEARITISAKALDCEINASRSKEPHHFVLLLFGYPFFETTIPERRFEGAASGHLCTIRANLLEVS
jgi:hypothetical protein